MTPDYRTLCAELVKALHEHTCLYEGHESELVARGRALLVPAVAEGPTDEALWELYQGPGTFSPVEFARAVLARWGRTLLAEGPSELEQALTIQKLLALVEDLEGALLSAADSLEDWGSYVDSYYKAKHAFDADVANAKSHAQRARNVINGEDIIGEIDD